MLTQSDHLADLSTGHGAWSRSDGPNGSSLGVSSSEQIVAHCPSPRGHPFTGRTAALPILGRMTVALLIPAWLGLALLAGVFLGALVRHGDRSAATLRAEPHRPPVRLPAPELPRVGATT